MGIVWKLDKLWLATLHELAASRDAAAVGPLIEIYADLATRPTSDQEELLLEVREALTQLLPRLREVDTHLINRKQRTILQTIYRYEFRRARRTPDEVEMEENLHIAVLQGLSRVGDESDLNAVRPLLEGSEASPLDSTSAAMLTFTPTYLQAREQALEANERVVASHRARHDAVLHCCAELGARLQREHAAETHLRASTMPDETASQLLRAAAPQHDLETAGRELLRAVDQEQGDHRTVTPPASEVEKNACELKLTE
jgi:hypothetical protein